MKVQYRPALRITVFGVTEDVPIAQSDMIVGLDWHGCLLSIVVIELPTQSIDNMWRRVKWLMGQSARQYPKPRVCKNSGCPLASLDADWGR